MAASIVLVKALEDYILRDEDKKETMDNLRRYRREFFNFPEYNWYRYGNILPYYSQIRDFFRGCGIVPPEDNERLEKVFFPCLRQAIDNILEANK